MNNYNSMSWKVAQWLRRRGLLSEGYNIYTDRYEYRFFGMVYNAKKFVSFKTDTHPYANVKPSSVPATMPTLTGNSLAVYAAPSKEVKADHLPFTQVLGYEMLLPNGQRIYYRTGEEMLAGVKKARPFIGRYNIAKNTKSPSIIAYLKERTGLSPSQLGCDHADRVVVRNTKTGKFITFPVRSYSDSVASGYAKIAALH